MICRLCDEDHAGHCSRQVKLLRERLNEVEALNSKFNKDTLALNKKFNRAEYMREYMRKRRAG